MALLRSSSAKMHPVDQMSTNVVYLGAGWEIMEESRREERGKMGGGMEGEMRRGGRGGKDGRWEEGKWRRVGSGGSMREGMANKERGGRREAGRSAVGIEGMGILPRGVSGGGIACARKAESPARDTSA